MDFFFVFKNIKTVSLCQVKYTYLKSRGFPDFFLYFYRFWCFIGRNELNHGPQNIGPCPYIQNVWIIPSMAKDVIKLRILRGKTYLGLTRRALNAITFIFMREKQFWDRQKRRNTDTGGGSCVTQRDWSSTATSQGTRGVTGSWKWQK